MSAAAVPLCRWLVKPLAAERVIRWTDAGTSREFAVPPIHSHNSTVTAAGKHIVDDFANLPDQEKREVLANLLRISHEIQYPAVSDEELVTSAESLFLEYDRKENTE